MEPRIKVLELFLDALGEDSEISSFSDRLRVQKAVYLGQLFGADLGYRYSWYIKGPYCTSLTQDYFELDQKNEADNEQWVLNPELTEKLTQARAFLTKPDEVNLTKAQWYELLASLHYLYAVSKMPTESVKNKISETKPYLVDWIESGTDRLKNYALI